MPLHQVPQSGHAKRGWVNIHIISEASLCWYFKYFVLSWHESKKKKITFHNVGVRLDRVRGGRQKYKRRPEVENATYQSAPLPLTKESEKGEMYFCVPSLFFSTVLGLHGLMLIRKSICANEMKSDSIALFNYQMAARAERLWVAHVAHGNWPCSQPTDNLNKLCAVYCGCQ